MRQTTWSIRVYYEDTDSYGIVYYANYLKYMERGRTEHMRTLGFDQASTHAELDLIFPVRRVEVDYLQAAVFDDLLNVETQVAVVSGAKMEFEQIIRRQQDDIIICKAKVMVASICASTFRPIRLPKPIYSALEAENG